MYDSDVFFHAAVAVGARPLYVTVPSGQIQLAARGLVFRAASCKSVVCSSQTDFFFMRPHTNVRANEPSGGRSDVG